MVSNEVFIAPKQTITGTLVWYYFICKREVWLMSRGITPDEDFSFLEVGRAIHEVYYERMLKEVSLEGMKLDLVKYGEMLVCEVKTSSKFLQAAKFQLLYYLYRLEKIGLKMCGEIRIPKERKRIKVYLNEEDKNLLLKALKEIKEIANLEKPPAPEKTPFCKKCAYKDFCWI
jgi:CRISPR-associated exonuclease Cas4